MPSGRGPLAVCLTGAALILVGPTFVQPLALHAQSARPASRVQHVALTVERPQPGAPVTFGVPMPVKALDSPDHVRVLTPDLREVPSQVTEVATWEPQDPSVKWIWVFFFTTTSQAYILEFGARMFTRCQRLRPCRPTRCRLPSTCWNG